VKASAWTSGLTYATTTVIGIATLNPVTAVTGAITFTGWLFEQWQEASREPSPAERPSVTVPELINSVSRSDRQSGWFQEYAATEQAPTRESDEKMVRKRAGEIARSGRAGTNFDNRLRAVIELKIAQRAAEIARSPNAGSDLENWLRAERELKTAQRAEEIAKSPGAGTARENWLRAEHDVDVAQRAKDISYFRPAGDDNANWFLAEHELEAEHAAISQRAEKIARSAKTKTEIRTHAEIMLRAEDIAKSSRAGSDWENWLRADRELAAERAAGRPRAGQADRAYRARLDERVQQIAASPEAALGCWLKAEQELRAEGRIAAR
jgi:hypothetical protein